MRARALGLLTIGMVIAGCGTAAVEAPSASPITPLPGRLGPVAGEFKALQDKVVAQVDSAVKQLQHPTTFDQQKSAGGQAWQALLSLDSGLRSLSFPASAQKDVSLLLVASTLTETDFQGLANAKTAPEMQAALDTLLADRDVETLLVPGLSVLDRDLGI